MIFFLILYAKNEIGSLSAQQKKQLKEESNEIKKIIKGLHE